MTPTIHPLSETAAAELWDAHRDPGVFPFHAQGRLYVRSQIAMLRAAFDAGRAHERAHELPTEDGAVIVPADGHEYITAAIGRWAYRVREAMLSNDRWHGVWRTATGEQVCYSVRPVHITPGTWQEDNK